MDNVHLLVLVHGMWGNPMQLAELVRVARKTHADSSSDGTTLHILVAETVRGDSTYDGIDWGGERIAAEVLETVQELEAYGRKVVRFSITGYSLGGLISRYCIGVLDQQGFFDTIEPVNFITIATPHCGLPRYPSILSTITSKLAPRLMSRTGEQFFCADRWSPNGRPLIVVMADPTKIFYQALQKFKHLRIYANAINDGTVPFVTAAIELEDPFLDADKNGIHITFNEDYPCLIANYSMPNQPPPPAPSPTMFTRKWFERYSLRSVVPPALRFPFPVSILVYIFIPVIVPIIIFLLLSRFAVKTQLSRSRIKVLEREFLKRKQKALLHILTEIEHEVEEALADFIDSSDPVLVYQTVPRSSTHPLICSNHRKIAAWLNALPIQKEFAYFEGVANSHTMIVCRDIQTINSHRLGEPVVRHWASHFVM